MRFLPEGPDIPAELISAQERGQTIFVCGAGVSRNAGLPLFRGLVEGVYQHLGEDWNLHAAEREGMRAGGAIEGQYDRVLRCLERRLAASDAPRNRGMRERIRAGVRHVLAVPDKADLANHQALLELSRDAEGRNRLLTTNFDTLFERAWYEKYRVAIASHAGMAMPQPKVAGCTGVLHLHGRLADPKPELDAFDSDLVLTSAEFGDAYLRSGWASRYMYDLVRAYTVVLVGYQADDPPMRYLLEALEADRERYPDLQKVYAFAATELGNEELTRALWAAKAVEPILYTVRDDDHAQLYNSLIEWRSYAEDPTAWRRERMRRFAGVAPGTEDQISDFISLLSHGDACQLLGELSPVAEWLTVFVGKRVFDQHKELPGEWIGNRINDPAMIKACADLDVFDDQVRWHIDRGLERERENLSPARGQAWRLILNTKRRKFANGFEDSWYRLLPGIKRGDIDFEVRRLVSQILRPRLKVSKTLPWYEERAESAPETLRDLLNLDFDPIDRVSASELVSAWPQNIEHEIALFQTLNRTLFEALEEAQELGFLGAWDRASHSVPSVASHGQNAYRRGFYPLARVLADMWLRVARQDQTVARKLVVSWAESPLVLPQRLALFAYASEVFSPSDVATKVMSSDDAMFWHSGRVEIMRLLVAKWAQFKDFDRLAIEMRLRQGEPRELYRSDAFENDDEWSSVHDSSIYKGLKRIELAGGALTAESLQALGEIAAKHPAWTPGAGDRDDFSTWHEMRSGPDGQPELLAGIADGRLVEEAMRLQREQRFEQGDVWRVFCMADPDRALRGLELEARAGKWNSDAWRCLLWAANEKGDRLFQLTLADLMAQMPDEPLIELLPSATSWLQRRRDILAVANDAGGPRYLALWDRFADVTYPIGSEGVAQTNEDSDDLMTESLNRPSGILAWSMLDALSTPKPHRNTGIPGELLSRFDRLMEADGRAGLLARVYLARSLAYLDAIDPAWVAANFDQRLMGWDHPEAVPLLRSYAVGGVGSARLFNVLKPTILSAFENSRFSDVEFEGLVSNLLSVLIWHQRGEASEYHLTAVEVRRALTLGPASARKNVSWNLWRMMGREAQEDDADPSDTNELSVDRATRWRTIIGPIFQSIWPLDVRLRSKGTSHNLVLMALECEAAFPEAVEAILDLVVPYELYQLSHSLRLEDKHSELVRRFPLAFVRLVNALIDPNVFRIPADLASFLQDCVGADPGVIGDPAYRRLYGLRRQRNA